MLWVLDGIDVVGMVTVYNSIIWTIEYNGLDDFELVVPCSDEAKTLLRSGRFLCRAEDRNGGTFENVMVIRETRISYDADAGYLLKVTGRGLKDILSQRIIWSQINWENENAEIAIRETIDRNVPAGDRDLPYFMKAAAHGFTEKITAQAAHENLADWIVSVCASVGFGWKVYISSGQIYFDLFKGTDRSWSQADVPPVVFSEDFGNLLSCEMRTDYTTYKNVALIGGEGEGTDQTTASVGSAVEYNRFEVYVDGSDVSSNGEIISAATYENMLKERGTQELAAQKVSRSFEAAVDLRAPYEIGTDYTLGDIVEIRGRFGMAATSRLAAILFYEDENGTKTEATFEEWEVS